MKFFARSLAEFQDPDHDIVVVIPQYFHRTLIVLAVVGMEVADPMRGPLGGHMTLWSLCSWSPECGLRRLQTRFRTQS